MPDPIVKVFQSTHLHSATFTPNPSGITGTLEIRFGNGRVYTNDPVNAPVPVRIWEGLQKTSSPGQYFDKYIKPYWAATELTQDG